MNANIQSNCPSWLNLSRIVLPKPKICVGLALATLSQPDAMELADIPQSAETGLIANLSAFLTEQDFASWFMQW